MGLILPPSHAIHGTKPTLFCTLCPKAYFAHEMRDYLEHCSTGHPLEEVQSHCPEFQAPGIFGRKSGDQEWAEWVERHRISDPDGFARWGRTDDGKSSSGLGDG